MSIAFSACSNEDARWSAVSASDLSRSAPATSPVEPGNHLASDVDAADFVTAYVVESGEAVVTGDPSRLEMMAADGCLACAGMAQGITDLHAVGGSLTTEEPPHQVTAIVLTAQDSSARSYDVTLIVSAGRGRSRAGGDLIVHDGHVERWTVDVIVDEGYWKIREIYYPGESTPGPSDPV